MDSLCVLQVSTHGSMEELILVWKYPRMSRLASEELCACAESVCQHLMT
jgi:hypothetical protein